MARRFYLIMLLCFSPLLKTYASDTVIVHSFKDLDKISLIDHASFFEDRSGNITWQEAFHQPFNPGKPHPFQWFDSVYGKRRVTLWFRITVQNAMNDSAQMVVLFHYSFFREVVVLSPDDTVLRRPNYFFTTRRKADQMNIIAPAAPGEFLTFLICLYNPYENLGPMTIMSEQAHSKWSERTYRNRSGDYVRKIMFLAVIVFITLHTLAQYFMRRRREFIWYAFYSTSVFLLFLHSVELQHYFDVFFSYFPYVQKYAADPLFMAVSYLYLRFAREYVDFKSLVPWYYQVIIWTERLILATVVVHQTLDIGFNNYALAKELFTWLRILLLVISFAGIFLLLRSGKKVLYFFAVGTLSLVIGLVLSMVFLYYPNANPFGKMENMRYIEIGVILELLCFTSGLSYKSRLIEVEKHNTQQQLIHQLEENRGLQEKLNVKLEAQTKEQTEQILAQQLELEKEKEQQLMLEFTKKITEMELQLLKSQINPHFYFNTLNNLYGLAMIAPKKAPDAILKLSDIMEYVIYDCRNDKVPLGKELKFLQSYIELEKLRYDDNARISMEVSGKADNRSISPMLLIQFVENAFKHGIETDKSNSYLHINIKVNNGSLQYESANSINGHTGKNGGIGLSNVRKRLDLLYPQKHDLQVISGDDEFRVKLKLTL